MPQHTTAHRRLYRASEGSQISKLVPDSGFVLVGEERDPVKLVCSLFATDVFKGHILWSGTEIDIPWWFTVQAVTDSLVILQAYEESPLPQPAGIYAIDLITGSDRWAQPLLEYVTSSTGCIYGARRGLLRSEYFKIDALTGNIVEAVQEEELPSDIPSFDHMQFPTIVDPAQIASGELETLIDTVVQIEDIRGTIEEFVHGNLIVASVYSRETKDAQSMLENRLRQDLFIFERTTKKLLFQDQIQSSASYPVTGSYFLTNRLLIYVKESNELNTIDLSAY